MLIGEYKHSIDSKKRMSLPAKFRKEMGVKVVLTRGLDTCLFLYTQRQWETVVEKLSTLSFGRAEEREFNRFMLAGAVEAEVDALGRILIPDFLKEFARLNDNVVVAGVYSRVEIWDHDLWQENKKKISVRADEIAQKLGDVGRI